MNKPIRQITSRKEARAIAHQQIALDSSRDGVERVLLDEFTIEENFGWVFFYDSKLYIETGDFGHRLAGNAPLVVTRVDGKTHFTGTAHPIEHYLKRFEQYDGD